MINNNENIFISELKHLSDLEIQKKYLNCLEWTTIITDSLSKLEDEFQVLKIIDLALAVDFILGATLAGTIKEEFQPKAIKLITDLKVCELVLIELLTKTKSQYALTPLKEILNNIIHYSQPSFYGDYKILNIFTFIKDNNMN